MSTLPPLVLAVLLQLPAAPAASPPALYAIENIPSGRGVVETRALVRLAIGPDGRLAKDTLLAREQRFFGAFRRPRIERGRFLVTGYGGVVDIPARKVIHDEQDGEVLGVDGAGVFYRVDNAFRPSGVFRFDLETLGASRVEKGSPWDLPGAKSPDGRMSIEERPHDGVIRLHQLGEAPRELGKAAIAYSVYSSEFLGAVPCLWLDEGRILVARTNHRLDVLTTRGEVLSSIDVKDATTEIVTPPRLWRDPLGRVVYSCGNHYSVIDVPGRAASRLEDFALGHGFEVSVAEDEELRSTIRYRGRVIGQWVCNAFEAKVAPGRIAFPYVRPARNANLGYPDGVAVWAEEVGDWRTAAMWAEDLAGWAP